MHISRDFHERKGMDDWHTALGQHWHNAFIYWLFMVGRQAESYHFEGNMLLFTARYPTPVLNSCWNFHAGMDLMGRVHLKTQRGILLMLKESSIWTQEISSLLCLLGYSSSPKNAGLLEEQDSDTGMRLHWIWPHSVFIGCCLKGDSKIGQVSPFD